MPNSERSSYNEHGDQKTHEAYDVLSFREWFDPMKRILVNVREDMRYEIRKRELEGKASTELEAFATVVGSIRGCLESFEHATGNSWYDSAPLELGESVSRAETLVAGISDAIRVELNKEPEDRNYDTESEMIDEAISTLEKIVDNIEKWRPVSD